MPAGTTEVSVCGINDSSFDEKVIKTFATATIEVKQAKKDHRQRFFCRWSVIHPLIFKGKT
jgi:hypothetical protein